MKIRLALLPPLLSICLAGCGGRKGVEVVDTSHPGAVAGAVRHLSPEGLYRNPAYSQAVVVSGAAKTVYVGGQNGVDAAGAVVGRGDIGAQAEQIFKNLEIALAAGGAGLEHVVKWNVYLVAGQPPQPAFEVFRRVWGDRPDPPLITLLFVSGLAHPDYLMELEAVAVVPQGAGRQAVRERRMGGDVKAKPSWPSSRALSGNSRGAGPRPTEPRNLPE